MNALLTDTGYTVPLKVEVARFVGACPFLTCLTSTEHVHPICPICKAVNFGNIGCELCRLERAS